MWWFLFAEIASAGPCNGSDAPVPYASVSCHSTCAKLPGISVDTLECTPATSGAGAVEFYGATNYASGSHTFSFWGTDGAGARFCCAYDEGAHEVGLVRVISLDADDTLYFSAASGSPSVADPGGTAAFDLYMESGLGDDVVRTSRSSSVDDLIVDGVQGNDDIVCYVNCTAEGGEGDDDVTGSDAFVFNTGADTLYGGDILFGESEGDDGISAGSGPDVVYASAGSDDVCGEAGADELYGEGDDDRITGASGVDAADGGTGSDQCSAETEVNCEETIVFPPNECP